MLASEIVRPARVLAKDPQPGTYSDDAYLGQLDLVCIDLITMLKFPFARISTATVAGQQEYLLPETPLDDGTGCVWLNGQLLTKTTLAQIQGQQIGQYDQTGMGTQSAGSAGPSANAGYWVPQWTVQPPTSFPAPNYQSQRTFTAPWAMGNAPKYVFHGGNILIIPAPNASALLDTEENPIPNLVIDMAMTTGYIGPTVWNANTVQPQCLTSIGQRIWFPSNFKNALVWGLVERILAADDTGAAKESRNNAGEQYRSQVNELYFWSRSFKSNDRISMQTNRGRYIGRWRRNSQYGGGYP